MKMNIYSQLLLLLIIFLSVCSLEAQRVGIDTENFIVNFIELPTHPVDFEYTAFSASISVRPDQLRRAGITEEKLLEDHINIPGLTKVQSNSFFHIEIVLDDFEESKPTIITGSSSRQQRTKEQTPVYFTEVTINLHVAIKVTDYNQEVLLDSIINDGSKPRTFRTRESVTAESARNTWNRNRSSNMRSYRRQYLDDIFETISNLLVERYGYMEQTNVRTVYEVLGNRRHPSYDAHQENFQSVRNALMRLRYNEPITEEIRQEVYPAIDFWKSEMKDQNLDERQERRLMYICLFNIATTYYWIEQLDSALKYLPKLEELDIRSERVSFLSNRIHRTNDLFKKTGFTSKHMRVEDFIIFDESKLPDVVYSTEQDLLLLRAKEERLAKEGVKSDAEMYSGTIFYRDGRDSLNCNFYLNPGKNGEISFLRGESNLIIIKDVGHEISKIGINKEVMSRFAFNDRNFILEIYSPGMAVTIRPQPEILEVLFESEHIQLLKYYPTVEATIGNTEKEFVIKKGKEDDLLSLHGRRFLNFNRALASYFEDCVNLSVRAQNGEFSRTKSDLIQLAELYNACKTE